MIFRRRTLRKTATFEGLGLHSGVPVKVTVHPSTGGIAFRYGSERVLADPDNVTDNTRQTKLGPISTVEHLMSAFGGLEITDAEVEVSAPEMPALDGSAIEYVKEFLTGGLEDGEPFEVAGLYERLHPREESEGLSISKGTGHWRFDFECEQLGVQRFESIAIVDEYVSQVAPARTTVFTDEIKAAKDQGLGQGLTEETVLIIGKHGYENAARFHDEVARHKLLDCIGDLYLSGIPIRTLNVVAAKSGHKANVAAARMLKQALRS